MEPHVSGQEKERETYPTAHHKNHGNEWRIWGH